MLLESGVNSFFYAYSAPILLSPFSLSSKFATLRDGSDYMHGLLSDKAVLRKLDEIRFLDEPKRDEEFMVQVLSVCKF